MFRVPGRKREEGQIVVLFALMLTMLMLVAALLYSGAQTLVLRRQLQNAGDAAALAAANLMEQGTSLCTSTRIATSGSGNDLFVAARSSIETNLGWTDAQVASRMTLSCPSAAIYGNVAISVSLSNSAPRYFGSGGGATVTTLSTGINGQVTTGDYSVALLDTSNPSWTGHGGRTGCASYLVNGGVTVTYEGSIMVDSGCTLATSSNGAVKALNSAFSMSLINGATMRIAGEASASTLSKITPTPVQNALPLLLDPLRALIPPCHATSAVDCLGGTSTLPAKDMLTTGSGQCKSTKVACVLSPGTYSNGLLAANGSGVATLLLRPGVYYVGGKGVQLKSGTGRIIAIPSTTGTCGGVGTCSDANAIARYCNPTNNNNGSCQVSDTTTPSIGANWTGDCPAPPTTTTCGVLIYNAPADCTPIATCTQTWALSGGSADTVDAGSSGFMLLRAYNPTSDSIAGNGTTFKSYKNVVLWQAKYPLPSASSAQPAMSMAGGACVTLSGTVYASGAQVTFGGNSCGSGGGSDAQLTLQFIVWDLTLGGSNNFYFAYRRNSFATPYGYGLVQ